MKSVAEESVPEGLFIDTRDGEVLLKLSDCHELPSSCYVVLVSGNGAKGLGILAIGSIVIDPTLSSHRPFYGTVTLTS